MLNRLKQFYAQNGICAENFDCPCQNRCRAAVAKSEGHFTSARELGIGERYLDGRPKIIVVSLDPGSDDSQPDDRQLRYANEPTSDKDLGRKTRHWYRTHEGVATMIKAVTHNSITVSQAALWFAHTSVVRCCANLPNRHQAPRELFRNCRSYLEQEIRILAPDIIWSQGQRTFDAMSWLAGCLDPRGKLSALTPEEVGCVRYLRNSRVWVHTKHPTDPSGMKSSAFFSRFRGENEPGVKVDNVGWAGPS